MARCAAAFIAVTLGLGMLSGCSSEDFDLEDSNDRGGSIVIEGNVIGDEITECADLTEGTTPGCTGQ